MNQQFMKEKKIVPLVLQMSVPMILSMAVNALYNIVIVTLWQKSVKMQ